METVGNLGNLSEVKDITQMVRRDSMSGVLLTGLWEKRLIRIKGSPSYEHER
jgi:hypothetical protein